MTYCFLYPLVYNLSYAHNVLSEEIGFVVKRMETYVDMAGACIAFVRTGPS